MEVLIILLKSLCIGGLLGFAAGVGAARMFHAPTTQALGAFRTLGEMNACEGDAASHFSFGLGFFFNAWASAVGAGAFTQDVTHRVVPNWAAASLLAKNKDMGQTVHNPKAMGIAGAIIGALVVAFLNTTATAIPESLKVTAVAVLVPAATLLINTVMPVLFWLAALDAGKRTGFWGTLFGGLAQLIMGNAVPGVVLGILVGKGIDELGWTRLTKIMISTVFILFILSGFFRGFDLTALEQFKLQAPEWLSDIHKMMGQK
ncbi:conserved hypothetical protein EF_0832/AHA_3913 [Pilibacter termitis]|uniref:EF_0832/AHA_3913 family protein n=1 Tax=Pilibacter termitis TaxID=263852 RepID=A0A1T4NY27_9ENTE|nr:DUF4311 domain-containing protein [Pilibacter termitis]SJZ83957.1 conserved hypothetical protein EF_0832/AHA_3913 [Pilibacter termitis]